MAKAKQKIIFEDRVTDRRLSLLIMQLKLIHEPILDYEKRINESVSRICLFIYRHTNIYLIDSVDEEVLYKYIQYHDSIDFREIDFLTAVRDVKNFLRFLKKNHYHVPNVDLSTLNFRFWSSL